MNKGLLSVEEALEVLLSGARPVVEVEEVPTLEATGRVLAKPQRSTMDVPPLDNSAMDGYAVRVSDLPGKSRSQSIGQRMIAGSVGKALAARHRRAHLHRRADSAGRGRGGDAGALRGRRRLRSPVKKADAGRVDHAAPARTSAGGEILPAGRRLLPQDTGLAASVGIATLPVRPASVRCGLFFTGDELVMPGEPLRRARIYNSNRFTLRGLPRSSAARSRDYGIVPDSLEATRADAAQGRRGMRRDRHLAAACRSATPTSSSRRSRPRARSSCGGSP